MDGGGGAYTGGVATATSTTVTLASAPFGPGSGTYVPHYNLLSWNGAAVMVLNGTGAGQWRRVVGRTGPRGAERLWKVDTPWTVLPDASSQIQIAPLRGHILLAENSWHSAYTVQLYGMCIASVVSGNVFEDTPFCKDLALEPTSPLELTAATKIVRLAS